MYGVARVMNAVLAGVLAIVVGASSAAAAQEYRVQLYFGGVWKAQGIYYSGDNYLCADLVRGNIATASLGGQSVNDFTTGDGASCKWLTGITDGANYNLQIVWRGDANQDSKLIPVKG